MHLLETTSFGQGQKKRAKGAPLLLPRINEVRRSEIKRGKRKRLITKKHQLEIQEAQVEKWLESTGRFPKKRWKIEQKRTLKAWFERLDKDGSGEIDVDELADPLLSTGLAKTMSQVSNLVRQIDGDKSSGIDFEEFLVVMKKDNVGNESQRSSALKRPARWSAVLDQHNFTGYNRMKKNKQQRVVKNPIAEFTKRQHSEHMDLKSVLSRERRKLLLDATMRQADKREKAHEQINRWRTEMRHMNGTSKFRKIKEISMLIQRLETDRVEKESFVDAMTGLLGKMQAENGNKIDENEERRIRTPAHRAIMKERNVSMLRREKERQYSGSTRRALVYPRTRNPSLPSILSISDESLKYSLALRVSSITPNIKSLM